MFPQIFVRAVVPWRLRAGQITAFSALLLLGACVPRPAPVAGPDPVDPTAAVPGMKAGAYTKSYVSRRPVEPSTRWTRARKANASNSRPVR
jgi:hypothetical protein